MDEGRLYLTPHALRFIEEMRSMEMTTPSTSGKRAARMTAAGESFRDEQDDFVASGRKNIEGMLNGIQDQINEMAERVGGIFHRFDPVLVMPMPRPDVEKSDPSAESMQSSVYDTLEGKRDQLYRVNRQLEELLDRCNL
jgi:hypothetical protein